MSKIWKIIREYIAIVCIVCINMLTICALISIDKYNSYRYVSIGFDDWRASDFYLVEPLFDKYKASTTFNRIGYSENLTEETKDRMDFLLSSGHEIGDHTWFHYNPIFSDPLLNGQNPKLIEGNQTPYPSNDQIRNDRGDGKNVFGFPLNESIASGINGWDYEFPIEGVTWEQANDEECQIVREAFAIYKRDSDLLKWLDELSNKYLGTTGYSYGSWDDTKGCYAGGIFTGSKTSENHEIWERYLDVTEEYYKDQYKDSFKFFTWSWPGSTSSPFLFESNGCVYYDSDYKQLYNYCARFTSSINDDERRSWLDCLRKKGYHITHDSVYPGRKDGSELPAMRNQMILNAFLSRQDALTYSTSKTIYYDVMQDEYPEDFFTSFLCGSKERQMYDAKGSYYQFIEATRHDTANGIVHGEVIDSFDTYSERVFLRGILEYCKSAGIKVVSKQQAYDICFNSEKQNGNLIYNPFFHNSAKQFLKFDNSVPDNPDGYHGDCYVDKYGKENRLVVKNDTYYLHYGIPLGLIKYSVNARGAGTIKIYAIRNKDSLSDVNSGNNERLFELASIIVSNDSFKKYQCEFFIKDMPITEYEQHCEGYGEKITGIKIVYSKNIEIKNVLLKK